MSFFYRCHKGEMHLPSYLLGLQAPCVEHARLARGYGGGDGNRCSSEGMVH